MGREWVSGCILFCLLISALGYPADWFQAGSPNCAPVVNQDVVMGAKVQTGASTMVLAAKKAAGAVTNYVVGDAPYTLTLTLPRRMHFLITASVGTLSVQSGSGVSAIYPDPSFGDLEGCTGVDDVANGVIASSGATTSATVMWTPPAIGGKGPAFFTLTASPGYGQAVSQVSLTLTEGGPSLATQSVNFPPIGQRSFGDAPFHITAIASSGLPVSFASSDPSIASISQGNLVTINGAGTVTITATQAGDSSRAPATATQNVVVRAGLQSISFTLPPQISVSSAASMPLNAMASSGLPVFFETSDPTIASITDNMLRIHDVGTVTITASQAGSPNWSAAQPVSQSMTITPSNQTITFNTLPPVTYGVGPLSLSNFLSIDSRLPIYLTSSDTSVAVVSGLAVTVLSAGTTTFTASQPGNRLFNAARSVSQTFVVNKGTQIIQFSLLNARSITDRSFQLAAIASSGLTVTFTSSNTAVATISGNTVQLHAQGETTITASQPGNTNWYAAEDVTQTLSVLTGGQTITFNPLPTVTFGTPSIDLTATASSGLPLVYSSSNLNVATVSGSRLMIVGAGTSTITASQAGSESYLPASITATLVVQRGPQTISFPPLPSIPSGSTPSVPLLATSSSKLPITYTSSDPSVATISGNSAMIVGEGSVVITATQVGDSNYLPADAVSHVLNVYENTLQPQTIAFGALSPRQFGDASFGLVAVATPSNYPVVFYSSNPEVATVDGNMVTIMSAGTTTITATQNGDSEYAPASPVQQVLLITRAKQVIDFPQPAIHMFGEDNFVLVATASSGLPVSFTSSDANILEIQDGETTFVRGAGNVTITATQGGDSNYEAAAPVTAVLSIRKAPQTITFSAIPPVTFGDDDFILQATATSELPVVFNSSNTSVAIVNADNTLHITGAGSAVIAATQGGNNNFHPAPQVTQTLVVAKASQRIRWTPIIPNTVTWTPGLMLTLTATASSGLPVTFEASDATLATLIPQGDGFNILAAGELTITATQSGDNHYDPAVVLTQTLTILPASQVINFPPLAVRMVSDLDFAIEATASSQLPIAFFSSDESVAVIEDGVVSIVGSGSVEITATQEGDGRYGAAQPVTRTLVIEEAAEIAALTPEGVRMGLRMMADSHQQSLLSRDLTKLQSNLTAALNDVFNLPPSQVVIQSISRSADQNGVVVFFDILPPNSLKAADAIVAQYASSSSALQTRLHSYSWEVSALGIQQVGDDLELPEEPATPTDEEKPANGDPATIEFQGRPITFGMSTTLSPGFTIFWNVEMGNIQIAVRSAPTPSGGWVGFGFAKNANEMVGSHAVVGYAKSGTSGIGDYYLAAQSSSAVKVTNEQKVIQQDVDFNPATGEVTILFTRPLAVEGISMIDMEADTNIVWASGSFPARPPMLTMHTLRESGTLNFASGASTKAKVPPAKQVHAVFMTIGWGFFIPLGIIVARFFKPFKAPLWFHIHRAFQMFGICLTTIGFVIGVTLIGSGHYRTHQWIGWAVTILGWFQIANGLLRPHKMEGKPITLARAIWFQFHSWSGRAATVAAFANFFLGLQILDVEYKWTLVVIVWTIAMGALFVVLQLRAMWLARNAGKGKDKQMTIAPFPNKGAAYDEEGQRSQEPSQADADVVPVEMLAHPGTTPAPSGDPVLGQRRHLSRTSSISTTFN